MRNRLSRFLPALAVVLLGVPACEQSKSPTQPGPAPCAYSLSASSLSFIAAGGSGSATVSAGSQCTWTATSDRAWMTISSGATGTGNGTVTVSVSANANTGERTGTLTVAGQAIAVRQDGAAACQIEISPTSASFGKDGGPGSFNVTAAQCEWTAASNAPWVTVTGGRGTGNGTVSYSVERNRDLTSRTAAIAIGGRTFTVTQAADTPPAPVCEYSVGPVEFTPCMSAGYTLAATVTTQQGCTWTAEPDASWITIVSGQSGAGSGTVSFRVSDNWDAPRQSVVKVRWPTVTAGQNLRVQQAGCLYAVSTASISMAAAGGTGRFDVIQSSVPNECGGATQSACVWSAQSDVPWITVTTAMPQAGDNPVTFTVAANPAAAARSGRITVKDKIVQITQAGQ